MFCLFLLAELFFPVLLFAQQFDPELPMKQVGSWLNREILQEKEQRSPVAASEKVKQTIILRMSNFGINQMKEIDRKSLTSGESFMGEVNSVTPELSAESQILLIMPPNKELDSTSTQDLAKTFAEILISRIERELAGRSDGEKAFRTFEIQYVQNVDTLTYTFAKQQQRVRRFETAGHIAFQKLMEYLTEDGRTLISEVIAGSNGTLGPTQNAALIPKGTSVDLFDGRTSIEDTEKLIQHLGPEAVRIFKTQGDFPAATSGGSKIIERAFDVVAAVPGSGFHFLHKVLGGKPLASIANFYNSLKLKQKYPDVRVYFLELIVGVSFGVKEGSQPEYLVSGNPFLSHLAGMNRTFSDSPFIIREAVGLTSKGAPILSKPAIVLGKDLRLRGVELQAKFYHPPVSTKGAIIADLAALPLEILERMNIYPRENFIKKALVPKYIFRMTLSEGITGEINCKGNACFSFAMTDEQRNTCQGNSGSCSEGCEKGNESEGDTDCPLPYSSVSFLCPPICFDDSFPPDSSDDPPPCPPYCDPPPPPCPPYCKHIIGDYKQFARTKGSDEKKKSDERDIHKFVPAWNKYEFRGYRDRIKPFSQLQREVAEGQNEENPRPLISY